MPQLLDLKKEKRGEESGEKEMENVKATWKYIISTPPPFRTLPSFNRPSLYHSNSSNRDAHIPSPSHLWPFRDWAHAVPTPLVMMMTGVHLSCYLIIKDNIQYLTINSREKIQIHDIAINSKKWRKGDSPFPPLKPWKGSR